MIDRIRDAADADLDSAPISEPAVALVEDPESPGSIIRGTITPGHAHHHVQSDASDTWEIVHELGYHPSVSVVDSAGTKVYGEVTYDTMDKVTVRFRGAFSGDAYLS